MPERALYNANDGLSGRDGGPYLDLEENRLAEIRRAKVEGREPDLDNPPASAGTVLVTAAQLLANNGVNNLPSTDGVNLTNAEAAVKALADDENNNLKNYGVLPEDAVSPQPDEVDTSMRSALMTDGTVPVGEKNDEPYKPDEKKAEDTTPEPNPDAEGSEQASDNGDTAPEHVEPSA
jgi:hypothetical protein